jgi:tetratricopeptide (TPR) repeat protein
MGYQLLEQGNYSEAEQYFLEAIKIFPHYSSPGNPYEGLAKIYRLTKNDSKLQNVLVDFLEITEYGATEAKELGKIFEDKDDLKSSVKYYLQSTQVDPYDINIHLRLADLYQRQGIYTSEIQERQAILALEPVDRSDAQFLLARSYLNNGQKSRAKREVLKALEIAPGFREAQKLLLKCVVEEQ